MASNGDKGVVMSLTVTEQDLRLARLGELSDDEFVAIIKRSLPYAYDAVERLAKGLTDDDVAIEDPPHMEDSHRNQLLRAFASTSMRGALERHFGIAELGFRNCHCIGAASPRGKGDPRWKELTSPTGQILAQRKELQDC